MPVSNLNQQLKALFTAVSLFVTLTAPTADLYALGVADQQPGTSTRVGFNPPKIIPGGLSQQWPREWTPIFQKNIQRTFQAWMSASDKEIWCAKNRSGLQSQLEASDAYYQACFFKIVALTAAFESRYNVKKCGDRGASCGILQIKAKFHCPKYRGQLDNPEYTAECGLNLMQRVIKSSGAIASSGEIVRSRHGRNMSRWKGLSGPWTVMKTKSRCPGPKDWCHQEQIYEGMDQFAKYNLDNTAPAAPGNNRIGYQIVRPTLTTFSPFLTSVRKRTNELFETIRYV